MGGGELSLEACWPRCPVGLSGPEPTRPSSWQPVNRGSCGRSAACMFGPCLIILSFLINGLIFLLQPVDMMDCIMWVLKVNPVLHTLEKSHLLMVHNSFYTLLASMC